MAVSGICVAYGSQTGRAEEYAWNVVRRLRGEGHEVSVGSMDAVGYAGLLGYKYVIFVCSTTGQGDPPDNMRVCWTDMRRRNAPHFDGTQYAVFGLGDSSYPKFNYIAKMLHNRAEQLKGTPLVPKGLGDEQDPDGISQAFDPWLLGVLDAIKAPPTLVRELPPRFTVERGGGEGAPLRDPLPCLPSFPLTSASLARNTRLTADDHWQEVWEYQFDVADVTGWEVGGALGLFPRNPPKEVALFLKRLGAEGEGTVTVHEMPSGVKCCDGQPTFVGHPVEVSTIVECCLDICGTPGAYFFEVLSRYIDPKAHEDEHRKLLEFAAGGEDLRFYCTRERRSYVEVLCDFKNVTVPLAVLLEHIPVIRPRLYSVSCAPQEAGHPTITVAFVEYKTPYGREKKGLCSQWLRCLPPNANMQVFFQPPTLRMDFTKPLVLVGPGTGIAPCRAIVQHALGGAHSGLILVRGCRNKGKDDLYHTEWEEHAAAQPTFITRCAYSRDQDKKVYVQHVIREDATIATTIVRYLLEDDGYLYICGSSKRMPQDVQTAIVYCFVTHASMSEEEGWATLEALKKARRIQLDTWS